MTIPNIITIGRLLMVPCFIGASIAGMHTAAFVIFVTAAATDILDGMVARRLNQRSRLGALLDPAADKMLMVSGYLFYTLASDLPVVRIPIWLTFVVFVRDFLIALFAYLLYTRLHIKQFPPLWPGKISTVLQAVTLGCVIAVNGWGPALLPLAEALFRVVMLMTLFAAWIYMRRSARWLREEEPAPA